VTRPSIRDQSWRRAVSTMARQRPRRALHLKRIETGARYCECGARRANYLAASGVGDMPPHPMLTERNGPLGPNVSA